MEPAIFAEVLHECLRPSLLRHCNLYPMLDAASRVLLWVDRKVFTEAFRGGAIEYFYEPFLAAFDPALRDRLGVWYTPPEIAQYQVARVDHHLRVDLHIADGLASEHVVVLDPAVGTRTYLRAVAQAIYNRHVSNDEPKSVAAERTRRALMERVAGFEIVPAAFVICHLHLGLLLAELGVPLGRSERVRVYLTNSLTGWDASDDVPLPLFPALQRDIEEARDLKRDELVLVVLGNPPYQGYSSAETEEEQALVEPWVAPLWEEWGVREHRLNDLYVRFWRMSIRRITELTGRGVVSLITNRKWLGGRSYPVMRQTALYDFQRVVIDDLHGGVPR